jgi:hypothetical protein
MQPKPLVDEHQIHRHVPDQHHEGGDDQVVIGADPRALAVTGHEAQGHEDGGKDGERNRHISNVAPRVLGEVLLGRKLG